MVWAIDVSRWQGNINWTEVARTGVAGAWIKVGGSDAGLYADGKGKANMEGAEANGVAFGTYYFSKPQFGGGASQARHAVSLGHGRGQLWPTLDLEITNGLSGAELDRFALEFCAEVKRLTGRQSIIYTGAFIGLGFVRSELAKYPLWIANYGRNVPGTTPPSFDPPIPPMWPRWDAWQFNSVTWVPGIRENVTDQNVVTPSLWAEMTVGVPDETGWTVGKSVLINGESGQYVVAFEHGQPVKWCIPTLAMRDLLVDAGVIEGDATIITDPDRINELRNMPEAGGQWGAVKLAANTASAVIAEVKAATDRLTAAIAAVEAPDVDEGAVASAVGATLADQLPAEIIDVLLARLAS